MWLLFDFIVIYTYVCVIITIGWIIGKVIEYAYNKIEDKRG